MCDSHNSIDSIGPFDCIDSIDIDAIGVIDSVDDILVPHKRSPTFTPHTKGRALRAHKQQYRWCEREARAPSVLMVARMLLARTKRAPPLCVA